LASRLFCKNRDYTRDYTRKAQNAKEHASDYTRKDSIERQAAQA
jgi:hypothetical protein